jgi:hypothetical protein
VTGPASEKVEVSCACGKTYRAPNKPGRTFACKQCGAKLAIPGAPAPPEPPKPPALARMEALTRSPEEQAKFELFVFVGLAKQLGLGPDDIRAAIEEAQRAVPPRDPAEEPDWYGWSIRCACGHELRFSASKKPAKRFACPACKAALSPADLGTFMGNSPEHQARVRIAARMAEERKAEQKREEKRLKAILGAVIAAGILYIAWKLW